MLKDVVWIVTQRTRVTPRDNSTALLPAATEPFASVSIKAQRKTLQREFAAHKNEHVAVSIIVKQRPKQLENALLNMAPWLFSLYCRRFWVNNHSISSRSPLSWFLPPQPTSIQIYAIRLTDTTDPSNRLSRDACTTSY